MNASHQDFISRSSGQAKELLNMYGTLSQLNVLWAGAPNYDALITQEEIDSVPSFAGSGLTTTTLADAEFILATIKDNISNALVALTVLGNLP